MGFFVYVLIWDFIELFGSNVDCIVGVVKNGIEVFVYVVFGRVYWRNDVIVWNEFWVVLKLIC